MKEKLNEMRDFLKNASKTANPTVALYMDRAEKSLNDAVVELEMEELNSKDSDDPDNRYHQ